MVAVMRKLQHPFGGMKISRDPSRSEHTGSSPKIDLRIGSRRGDFDPAPSMLRRKRIESHMREGLMNKKLFEYLVKSMTQMYEILRGERAPSRKFYIDADSIKKLRSKFIRKDPKNMPA
jgi:hypothetical protein